MFTKNIWEAEQRVLFNGEQEQLFWDRLKVAKWVNCWLESEDWSSFCLRIISSHTLCKVKFVDLFARSRLNDFSSHRTLTTGATIAMAKPFYKLRTPQIRARAINKTTDLEFALFSWKTNFPFRFVSIIIPLQPYTSAIRNSEENFAWFFPRHVYTPFPPNCTNFHNYHFRLLFKITEVSGIHLSLPILHRMNILKNVFRKKK